MGPEVRNRIVIGVVCGALVALGLHLSGGASRRAEARIEGIMAGAESLEVAQARALARDFGYANTVRHFETALLQDAEAFGLANVSVEALRQPNHFEALVTESSPVVIAAGSAHRAGPLRVHARLEKVRFERGGATIAAIHALAVVENVGSKPVAYFVRARSAERGECEVKGTRRHNAIALMPGESAEIVVCGGRGGVELLDLRALEITPIGYMYLSKVPPQTFGLDPARSQSHFGPRGTARCENVPSARISNSVDGGAMRWEDVADFYSRHNCDRLQVPLDYRRAETILESLPVPRSTP